MNIHLTMFELNQMRELNNKLKAAADAYYNGSDTIMSDHEYDELFDKLKAMEEATGIVLSDSVTQNVGYEVSSSLVKVKHPEKMLSLDKTKDREQLKAWLGDRDGCLSWKLDGLTLCLYYNNGVLQQAVTRGNGEVGEDVTANAKHINGIPKHIPFMGELIVRGEALITYPAFEKVNASLPDGVEPYKNPRNLASGTLRSLDSKVVADRNMEFYAFTLVSADDSTRGISYRKDLEWLSGIGFQTVYHLYVTKDTLLDEIEWFESAVTGVDYPTDGLVLMYDDVQYGASLGNTGHHPRNGMAFKWADETAETTLRKIEWSPSKTGLLNPVAVFDPVELEGTTVSRASVHNLSIVKKLNLKVGDRISVYKANMIIPQVLANLSEHKAIGDEVVLDACPICGSRPDIIVSNDGIEVVHCSDPHCAAKELGKFEHFVSRDAMNIVGMASSTIEAFVERGFIKSFADFYHLDRYREQIISMKGFGEKSYNEIIKSVEASRKTELWHVLYSLSIPLIGHTASKAICKIYDDPAVLPDLTEDQLTKIEGIGITLAKEYTAYWSENPWSPHPDWIREQYEALIKELEIQKVETSVSGITGKTFVITGSVHHWSNRDELKAYIESYGGKVSGSVSKNTDYLINNDNMSGSSKNKKAKELGIPIITEEEFIKLSEN